eukprot:ANDGO_05386.mRNA.1 hypothetical protein
MTTNSQSGTKSAWRATHFKTPGGGQESSWRWHAGRSWDDYDGRGVDGPLFAWWLSSAFPSTSGEHGMGIVASTENRLPAGTVAFSAGAGLSRSVYTRLAYAFSNSPFAIVSSLVHTNRPDASHSFCDALLLLTHSSSSASASAATTGMPLEYDCQSEVAVGVVRRKVNLADHSTASTVVRSARPETLRFLVRHTLTRTEALYVPLTRGSQYSAVSELFLTPFVCSSSSASSSASPSCKLQSRVHIRGRAVAQRWRESRLAGSTVSLGVEAQVAAQSSGSDGAHLDDLFLVGGIARGFRRNGIGPRATDGAEDVIGGSMLASCALRIVGGENKQEGMGGGMGEETAGGGRRGGWLGRAVPLLGMLGARPHAFVQAVCCVDVGSLAVPAPCPWMVAKDGLHGVLGQTRVVAGAGITVPSPFGPVELNINTPLMRSLHPHDDFSRFQLRFGASFIVE